ncbi:MAG: YeeE/YedE thiosulfate transporter family protein [Candidatus Paceibacterota bacterium]
MLEIVFPLGVSHYLIGGILVGLGISLPYLLTGIVPGVSTTFTSTWSYILRGSFFQTPGFVASRQWRLALVVGLMTGGLLYIWLFADGKAVSTSIEGWRLFIGGILIGIGTRMSGGCASGHGICGNAALERVSLVATLTFLATAIAVAKITSLVFGL